MIGAPPRWHGLLTWALIAIVLGWSLIGVRAFSTDYGLALRNAPRFLGLFFPPAVDAATLRIVFLALIETIQIAYAGTLIGALIAAPLAALATRSITGWTISSIARTILAVARTVPAIIWAILLIVMVGFGPFAGMLGIAAYTVGYLGKLFYEIFEGVDPEVVEAVRATGSSRWQIVRHVVIAESANPLMSQLLFIFEYNIRASSIMGLVGAGGIGLVLIESINRFLYPTTMTILLFLLATVLAVDWASSWLRRRYQMDSRAARAY